MFVPYSAPIRPNLGQSGLKVWLLIKFPIKTRNSLINSIKNGNYVSLQPTPENQVIPLFIYSSAFIRPCWGQSGLKVWLLVKLLN